MAGADARTEAVSTASRPTGTRIELQGISKAFAGAQALRSVSVSVRRAEVHALVGENGAGKSTLGKVIAGAVIPDSGTIACDGHIRLYRSPREALHDRIALVHQEIALVPQLSILDNVFLGSEPSRAGLVSKRAQLVRFAELADQIGFRLAPNTRTATLRVSEQQKVELMRALASNADLIVLDEPTAALSAAEARELLNLIDQLRQNDTTFVYVSHHLEEVLAIADTISVLKDGELVSTRPAGEHTEQSLIREMLGRTQLGMFPPKARPSHDAPIVLRATNLRRQGVLDDVSFTVRAGEIVGIAGLVGSGRTEVLRAVFGADHLDGGELEVNGRNGLMLSPHAAVLHGIALLPEDRKSQALVMGASIRENLTLPTISSFAPQGILRSNPERLAAQGIADRVGLTARSLERPVATLSGGNQQKVAIGKWLMGNPPAVLLADEPTRGVDVGARLAIYQLLCGLAADGMGILVVSSDLEEVMGLAHRILVMRRGRIVSEVSGDADEQTLLTAAFGQS